MSADPDDQRATETGSEGTKKPGGLGEDGTIPPDPGGLGATTTDKASTFEPEEDETARAPRRAAHPVATGRPG